MLLGGPRAALRVFPPADFGEGLDLAGQYIDSQPGAEDFVDGTQFLADEMLEQYVRAPVRDVKRINDDADYLVFGVQYTMRGMNNVHWGQVWNQKYKFREPEFVVSFDGIPYAWVHRPGMEPIVPQPVNARLGESIHLVGYRLAKAQVVPGDTLLLTLYWRADALIEKDYTVFTHLQGPDGQLAAQQDNPPARGARPTSGWEPGALIEDPYEIQIPPDALPGYYPLGTGMYNLATLERLPAYDCAGQQLSADAVHLAEIVIEETP
jgi:hypothetical protein